MDTSQLPGWRAWFPDHGLRDPKGLLMGLGSVLVAQVVLLVYYGARRLFQQPSSIQWSMPQRPSLWLELKGHVSRPESFIMVFGYLSAVWCFNLMPQSYYDLSGGVCWMHVLAQFLVVDFFTFVDHLIEHNWARLYKHSHKAHHVWVNPKLFDAFNGSILDTASLILIPLFLTHQVCSFVNCWSFIAFGTLYASQFTLIHCEFTQPWDPVLEFFGIGTSEDHNVHHALFNYNFGHFFTYYDKLWGSYRSPHVVRRLRSAGIPPDLPREEAVALEKQKIEEAAEYSAKWSAVGFVSLVICTGVVSWLHDTSRIPQWVYESVFCM